MTSWNDLDQELAFWQASATVPSLWWRDDDAIAPSAGLDRLLALTAAHDIPMHLAVIPQGATRALAARLADESRVSVMQHGLAHINHEPVGNGASEMGNSRSAAQQRADLENGWALLQALDLQRLIPAFAAPWNRVGSQTPLILHQLGFRLVSTNLQRQVAQPVPGLLQVNVHADPIRWKTGAAFRGEAGFLSCVVDHLQQRRLGLADPDEPTGVTTHHLQTSDEIWQFLDRFCGHVAGRVTWVRMRDLLREMGP